MPYYEISYDDAFTGQRESELIWAFSQRDARKKRQGYTGVSRITVKSIGRGRTSHEQAVIRRFEKEMSQNMRRKARRARA